MPLISEELSEREVEILRLIATGVSNKEIAQQLHISVNTVKVHARNIFAKIGVTTRTEAAMYAVVTGLTGNGVPPRPELDPNVAPTALTIDAPSAPGVTPAQRSLKWGWILGGVGVLLTAILALWITNTNLGLLGLSSAIRTPTLAAQPASELSWNSLAPMFIERSNMAVALYENEIYAIGGQTNGGVTSSVERYNFEKNDWQYVSSKQVAVRDAKAAVLAGKIYVPGGLTEDGKPKNILEIYSPEGDHWTYGKPLPKAISAYAMTAFEGKLYVMGGWDGEKYLDSVYVYSPDEDEWEESGSRLPAPRARAEAVVSNGKIFLIGGFNGRRALTTVEKFIPDRNPTNNKNHWESAVPLRGGRYSMGGGSLAEVIYLVGGRQQQDDAPSSLLSFSPASNQWEQISIPPMKNWYEMGLVVSGTNLYMLGGEVDGKISNQLISYQAIYMLWLPMAP